MQTDAEAVPPLYQRVSLQGVQRWSAVPICHWRNVLWEGAGERWPGARRTA